MLLLVHILKTVEQPIHYLMLARHTSLVDLDPLGHNRQKLLHQMRKQVIFLVTQYQSTVMDTYVIVGAYGEDGGAGDPISNAGAAYVFTRSGSTWTQQAKIQSSDAEAE
jgi:hypothetical protein